MSRCKACNNKMTEQELCHKTIDPVTMKFIYSDICFACSAPYEDYTEFIETTIDVEEDD